MTIWKGSEKFRIQARVGVRVAIPAVSQATSSLNKNF